ncbi:PhzF family phenazine biosynthesis protein [Spirillospora sp. NPDC029432]|uniref:PhzF family phenazine biosynthesis protein n=1 Tax=Spirillospora sp. NPDC029432 TaxID=3154599 RepID=UPI003452734D
MTMTTPLPALGRVVLRYSAFAADPGGGGPAGVVLDAAGLDDRAMLAIAAELGYSETAFLTRPPRWVGDPGRTHAVRYFSPKGEVPFCGRATLAAAAALAERGARGRPLEFATQVGRVPVTAAAGPDGLPRATFTSVEPYVQEISPSYLAEALRALGWSPADLDPELPPFVGYAGARHLILAAAERERLSRLDYDFDRLAAYMVPRDLTGVQLVWRAAPDAFDVRSVSPPRGVLEDPASGTAAAAFGAYLRCLGAIPAAARVTLRQGEDLGRAATLHVELRAGDPRVHVSGTAVPIPA